MKPKRIIIITAAAVLLLAAASFAVWKFWDRHLMPAGPVSVVSFSPKGEEIPISVDGITVMFDRAVVPLTTLEKGEKHKIPIKIEPSISGEFKWLGTHGFIFRPDEPLNPATLYHVMLPAGVVAVGGGFLESPIDWTFTTVRPRVMKWSPYEKSMLKPQDGAISIQFNLSMDKGSVEDSFTLDDLTSGLPIAAKPKFTWKDDDHIVRIEFSDELPWDVKIRATIASTAKPKKGDLGLLENATAEFTTPSQELRVVKVLSGETVISPGKEIHLDPGASLCYVFNQAVLEKSFEKALKFSSSPIDKEKESIKANAKVFYYSEGYEELGFDEDQTWPRKEGSFGYEKTCATLFSENSQRYTFSIDEQQIKSLYGAKFKGEGEKYTVLTGHVKPLMKTIITKNIISQNDQTKIPYRGTNLKSVTARLYQWTDKSKYDENIKNDIVRIEKKAKVETGLGMLGWRGVTVPLDVQKRGIDREKMKPITELNLPFDADIDKSVRSTFTLNQFPQSPAAGIYLLELEGVARDDVGHESPLPVYSMIQVTPYAIAIKHDSERVLVWVSAIETGEPVANVPLQIDHYDNNKFLGHDQTAVTNEFGVAIVNGETPDNVSVCVYVTEPGSESYSCEEKHSLTGYRSAMRPGTDFFAFISTDRPIYRPGQQVLFSSFVREVHEGRYFTPAKGEKVSVIIRDAADKEIFKKENASLESGGVIRGNINLPDGDGASRGAYRISLSVGEQTFNRIFVVSSYRKPSFKIDLKAAESEMVSGSDLVVDVNGSYFFGAPLGKAKADWSIMTSTYNFDPEGYSGFNFVDDDLVKRSYGDDGYVEYEGDEDYTVVAQSGKAISEDEDQQDDPRIQGQRRGSGAFFKDTKGKDVASIPEHLDDVGNLKIKYLADLKKYPTSQVLSVEADIEDPSRQQVSGAEDIIVHKAEFYLGVKPEKWTYGENETARVNLVSLDTKGRPVGGRAFSVDVLSREYKFIERQNAMGYWDLVFEPQDKLIKTIKGNTGADGLGGIEFVIPKGGQYRFVAKARDSKGNEIQSANDLFAWGKGYVPWRIDKPEKIELVPDKDSYKIGETAKVLIKSLVPVTKALMTLERGGVLEYKIIDLGGNAGHIELPITQGMIPNFYISMIAHVGRNEEHPPLLYHGEAELHVEPQSKALDIAITPDRKGVGDAPAAYKPGEEVKVDLDVKSADGKPKKAHVIVSVADESVIRLLNFKLPNLIEKFFYRRPNTVRSASSLISLKAGDAGLAEGKKRRLFKDTAFFEANLVTDNKGHASFSFKLPDDLTTWVIDAYAITESKDRKSFEATREKQAPERPRGQSDLGNDLVISDGTFVGSQRATVMSTLPLVLRSALPRFVAWGDKFHGSVIANNRTDSPVSGKMKIFLAGSGSFKDGVSQQEVAISIPAKSEASYPVEIFVPSEGDAFSLSAQALDSNQKTLDNFEVTIPAKDRFAPEIVATSGVATQDEREQIDLPKDSKTDKGSLKVDLKASIALTALPSLKGLMDFPWLCSEQRSASLIAYIIAREMTERLGEKYFDSLSPLDSKTAKTLDGLDAKKAFLDEKIKSIISDLTGKYQTSEGGMTYWPEGTVANPFASVQSLLGFVLARRAGYHVDDGAFSGLKTYVRTDMLKQVREWNNWDLRAQAFWILAMNHEKEDTTMDELSRHTSEMSITGLSYFLLAAKESGQKETMADIAVRILSQAKVEPRHINWPPSNYFWSSSIKNTAWAAYALFENNNSDPNVWRALAYLLNRKKTTSRINTQDALAVSWFVSEYAKTSGEGRGDVDVTVSIDKKEIAKTQFDEENLLTQYEKKIPMGELVKFSMPADVLIGKKGNGILYYDMILKYYLDPKETPTREEGIIISREYFNLDDVKEERPLTEFKVGENYRAHTVIVVPKVLNYVVVEDLLPAGFEPIDMALSTSSMAAVLKAQADGKDADKDKKPEYRVYRDSGYDDVIVREDYGTDYAFSHQEIRDDAIVWSDEVVPEGVYHIRYPVRAAIAGTFLQPGAVAFEFYEPEIFGRGVTQVITVK